MADGHFHILLRTGPTPLSKTMRRLMTGYAVNFNRRHRRSGHLFQNRYKSVVCEEDTYLLELTRYIHMNPLRARLIEDLKSLDKYQWSGHSVLIGKQKNPLVPKIPPAIKEDKYLAEKTVEDVLQYFGKNLKEARRRYRVFVEKGIKHGHRTDLQGGGLVRPACHARFNSIFNLGDVEQREGIVKKQRGYKARAGRSAGSYKRGLLGRKKGARDPPDSPESPDGGRGKGDARILGSGDFVRTTLHQSEKLLERKYRPKKTIDDLIMVVAGKVGMSPELICSRSRQKKLSEARAIFSYLAVEETGYPAADVARFLGVKRMSVHEAVTRGKTLCAEYALLGQKRK